MLNSIRLHCLEVLIPGVAHEVNNHSQTILLSGQILQDVWESVAPAIERCLAERGGLPVAGLPYSALRQEIPECIANLLNGAERIEKLIAELRAFSGPWNEDRMQVVDLNHLAESTALLLASLIRKSTDRFTLRLEPGLATVRGYPRRIQQTLLDLLVNACHSLPDRCQEIGIRTRFDARTRRVTCEVYGAGSRVRDPEWAAMRKVVEEQGAEIDAEADPDQGIRVTMKFPPPAGSQ